MTIDKKAAENLAQAIAGFIEGLLAGEDPLKAIGIKFSDQLDALDDSKVSRFACYFTFADMAPQGDADMVIGENIWPLGVGVTEREAFFDALPSIKIMAMTRGIEGLAFAMSTIEEFPAGTLTDDEWAINVESVKGIQRAIQGAANPKIVDMIKDVYPTHPDEGRYGTESFA